MIYRTNAIESLLVQLRKIIKTLGHFPSGEITLKLMWLALRNVLADKVRSAKKWEGAMNQFAFMYVDRLTDVTV